MPFFNGLKSNALTAIVYCAMVAVGFAVRSDEYFFTVFSPAAGLGVAAAVYYPKRGLPGVLLAALLTPLVLVQLDPTLVAQQAHISLWMNSVIAVMHPLLALLLLRWASADLHNFDDVKELFKVIVIAGPLSAALAFGLSLAVRWMLSVPFHHAFPLPCMIGWMGYSLGVFVVYPMAALLLHTPKWDRTAWRSPLLLQFSLAFIAVVFIFVKIHQSENERVNKDFEGHAAHIADEFRHVFEREVEELAATKGLFIASDHVSREEFNRFAAEITRTNDSIAALEWVPNVSDAGRQSFVNQARDEFGIKNFHISEKNVQGKMQTAAKREHYFPVYYMFPFMGNERAHGFDLASNPVRNQSLIASANSGKPIASPPLRLVQGNNDLALLIFNPIYRNEQKQVIRDKGLHNVEGFVLGVFKLKYLFAPVLRRNDTHLTLQIKDAIEQKNLYQSEGFDAASSRQYAKDISLMGRRYRVSVGHSVDYVNQNQNWLINLLSALGLFILGIFSLFLLVRTRRNEYAEKMVRQQTNELRLISEDKQRKNELLASLSRSQADFISNASTYAVFYRLLMDVLQFTESRYGFILELDKGVADWHAFHVHAAGELGGDDLCYEEPERCKAYIINQFQDEIVKVISFSRPVALKLSETDAGNGERREWHSFLAIPIYIGEEIVGVVGLSDRDDGYNTTVIQYLEPFVGTCSSFIHAIHVASARRKAEAFVLEQESRLRAQFDNANDTIIGFDEYGIIESVNPAGENLSGYLAEDLIGKHLALLLPDCCGNKVGSASSFDMSMLRGLHESMLHNRRAERIPVEISTNQIEMPGNNLYCSVIRDLSERHKVDRMKNEFVATVSHELRTPLTSIQGALKLINSGVLENNAEKQKELLGIAQNNAERLLLLVNDLLDMEKIESGKLELFRQSLDLIQVLQQTQQQMESYAHKFDVSLTLLEHPTQAMVVADPNRLAQIFANLLSNAIKFTEKDTQVEIWVDDRTDYFRVSVRDYGPGITSQFKQRLFDKFTQADASSSRKQAGSGLGLSISKQLIELMGGHIAFVEAHPGTQFYIDVPKDNDAWKQAS